MARCALVSPGQAWRYEARHDRACPDEAGSGKAGIGTADKARLGRVSFGWARPDRARRYEVRPAMV